MKKDKFINDYRQLQKYFEKYGWDLSVFMKKWTDSEYVSYHNQVFKLVFNKELLNKYPTIDFMKNLIENVYKFDNGLDEIRIYYNPNLEEFQYHILRSKIEPREYFIQSIFIDMKFENEGYKIKCTLIKADEEAIKTKMNVKYENKDIDLFSELAKNLENEVYKAIKSKSKKIYYTKCGIAFIKNSTASVTGYEAIMKKCEECPFREKITRYKDNKPYEVYECKAGSKMPNHKNSYNTSDINNSTTLTIYSINYDWIENVRKEVNELEYVEGAYYNQDIEDCRKALSIAFAKNKKGIETKKQIINKYIEI